MDDGQVMLVGLGVTAIAGFAALAYAASSTQTPVVEEPKKKRRSRRRRKPVEVDSASQDEPSGEASADNSAADDTNAVAVPKKKKRAHKGRKKKKSAKSAETAKVVVDDGLGATIYQDDGNNSNSWEKIEKKEAKPKPAPKSADAADSEKKETGPPRESFTMKLGSKVGAVVGKRGVKINSIQDDTGARLSIERDSSVLTISGTASQIADAREMVEEAIADRKEGKPQFTGPSVTIDLGNKAGAVIGRGGSTIRQIETDTSTNLDIKRNGDDSSTCTIRGADQEAVDAAAKMVDDILSGSGDGPRGGPPSGDTVTMDLASRHGMFTILGSGGSQIRALQEKSGARLSLDKESYTVTIGGTEEQIDLAQGLISALLTASSTSATIELSSRTVGAVIGKQGATIRRIQKESNAHLDIQRDSDPIMLKIMGTAEEVASAKAMVEAVLSSPPPSRAQKPLGPGESEFTIELGRAVGAVIGKGGSTIQRLQEESGARLEIARESSSCRIVGTTEAVEKARKEVEAIVERTKEMDAKKAEKAAKIEAAGHAVTEASEETFAAPQDEGAAAADGEGDWGVSPAGW